MYTIGQHVIEQQAKQETYRYRPHKRQVNMVSAPGVVLLNNVSPHYYLCIYTKFRHQETVVTAAAPEKRGGGEKEEERSRVG